MQIKYQIWNDKYGLVNNLSTPNQFILIVSNSLIQSHHSFIICMVKVVLIDKQINYKLEQIYLYQKFLCPKTRAINLKPFRLPAQLRSIDIINSMTYNFLKDHLNQKCLVHTYD
ncbi:unnamed protein product [Paramecium octaurelia]|uniref:Uncharacterized protein n=1 Tax=Paramecium octaurelia TaxID=43137 RepID=A0A8S1TXQ5_PAROT|nr:unnamed protein product [Paramecium octaurelia]